MPLVEVRPPADEAAGVEPSRSTGVTGVCGASFGNRERERESPRDKQKVGPSASAKSPERGTNCKPRVDVLEPCDLLPEFLELLLGRTPLMGSDGAKWDEEEAKWPIVRLDKALSSSSLSSWSVEPMDIQKLALSSSLSLLMMSL
mmetsp:Transcript_67736/g.136091  ORF Transcript_67736/g.136091 Transcript_67736/m.136091 type:complete len:145 (+) Transcript_67736:75-509(+)